MEKNIFAPYKVLASSDQELTLSESRPRRIFLFFFFRIYPWVMLSGTLASVLVFSLPLKYAMGLLTIGLIFSFIAIFKNYVMEITINRQTIQVEYQTFLGRRKRECEVAEIEKITVETFYFGNFGGFYYMAKPKDQKTTLRLFTIPRWYMKLENRSLINQKLEQLTGIIVERW